ncbi:hypothetical protein AALP_AAs63782U000100, partial [Arabis alpina]
MYSCRDFGSFPGKAEGSLCTG